MTCVFCKDDRPFDFLEVWSDVLSKLASKWWAPGYGWHFPDFSEPFGSVVSMVFFGWNMETCQPRRCERYGAKSMNQWGSFAFQVFFEFWNEESYFDGAFPAKCVIAFRNWNRQLATFGAGVDNSTSLKKRCVLRCDLRESQHAKSETWELRDACGWSPLRLHYIYIYL